MSFVSSQQQDDKERIREATNIVDLIGGYLPLRRKGRDFVAICPWHDDSNPSLQVNPERQNWKCWVCDIGGDAFSFVMKYENVDFRESMKMLADRAGIELTGKPQPKTTPGSPNDKQTLFDAVAWAESQFRQCLLNSAEAAPAREYLANRGITDESIENFRIGFSPDSWQWLTDRCRSTSFSPLVLEAAGLLGRSPKSPRMYDRFKGRVIFPIHDPQGRPIAFGGRILPRLATEKSAKYINSPETVLYSKSDQLYALNLARDAIHHDPHKDVIVVEGYTDVVMAHQVGVKNVVAVCGTALGGRHLRLLRRYADRVTLVLDGDEAGQRRTNEILELFIAEQVDLRILTLPEGLDPCDFMLENGAAPFRELLETAVDALEHKFNTVVRGLDLVNDTHRAGKALDEILGTLAKAPHRLTATSSDMRLREQQMLARLARLFRIPESDIRARVRELRNKPQRALRGDNRVEDKTPVPKARDLDPCEVELFEILITHPDLAAEAICEVELGQLKSEASRVIFHAIHTIHDDGRTPDFHTVQTALDDPGLKSLLVELDERAQAKSAEALQDPQERLTGLIDRFHYLMEQKDHQQKQAALDSKIFNEKEEMLALEQLITQQKNRQGISEPTDGQDS